MKLSDPTICSKKWSGIVKSLCGQKIQGTIPPLVEGPRTIFDAKEKAELFKEYFASRSSLDDSMAELPSEIEYFQSSRILSHVTTTEREIRDLFRCLYASKACGPDGTGNKIIRICADGLSRAFTKLVNIPYSVGVFPEEWKFANVIAIFKKDDRQSKLNYRPISLLDSFSKITEKVVLSDFII